MENNEYHFLTRWRVEGTCGEVADVLGDPLTLARWWPSVYLDESQALVEELLRLGVPGYFSSSAFSEPSARCQPNPITS